MQKITLKQLARRILIKFDGKIVVKIYRSPWKNL